MKKQFLFVLAMLSICLLNAQEITGQWNGLLEVQGIQLAVVFNIEKSETGYVGTMDSPDQGVKGIPLTSVTLEKNDLNIAIENAKISYEGTLDENNSITGNFKQGGFSIPMNLSRNKIEKAAKVRPQDPIKPYPYNSEDITFLNKTANINLAGTFTSPKTAGPFPVVILISGSGAQNRDEEILGHRPFLVLSDHLTKNGIAVLRFDDRGTADSEGDFTSATSADFATDVEAAIAYLKTRKDINKKKIGLLGHSEGGMIAPMVASRSKDVAFIVLNAGPGIPGDELLLLQTNLVGKAAGVNEENLALNAKFNAEIYALVKNATDTAQLESSVYNVFKERLDASPEAELPEGVSEVDYIKSQVAQIASPWMQYFIKYNPAAYLSKVKCPVLAINGSNDLQITAKENLAGIKSALEKGDNNNVTVMELPNLNHLFQESKSGAPSEYGDIEQTMSPKAMDIITEWIKQQTK